MIKINEIKKVLKSSSLGRRLYLILGRIYNLYKVPKRRKALKKSGYQIIQELMEIADKENIEIIPWAGTLLGLYRDQRFIPDSNDMDFALLSCESIREFTIHLVEKYGYKFNQALSYLGMICEVSFEKKGVDIDFFILFDKGSHYDWFAFFWDNTYEYSDPRQNHVDILQSPKINGLKSHIINKINVKLPVNAEEELLYLYGSRWKTPGPRNKGRERPVWTGTASNGYSLSYSDLITDQFNVYKLKGK